MTQRQRSILSKLKRKYIGLLPRKFHCFCVGAPKTGTTSIAWIFRNYRSAHEPDPIKTTEFIIKVDQGFYSKEEAISLIKERDKLLNLEIESGHPLVYISDLLVEIFPESRFIITIREPYSFLSSRLNYSKSAHPQSWKKYRKYIFGKYHEQYDPKEIILKNMGLYSLDAYLAHYAEHYKIALFNIPENRRLIIRTNELNNSIAKIAQFLNIKASKLKVSHAKKNKRKIKILEQMDPSFVRQKIWEHCSNIIHDFFPETTHIYK